MILDRATGESLLLAKEYGIKAVGFEIDPALVKDSRQVIRQAGWKNSPGYRPLTSCERTPRRSSATRHEARAKATYKKLRDCIEQNSVINQCIAGRSADDSQNVPAGAEGHQVI